jgi:hypothetical protein
MRCTALALAALATLGSPATAADPIVIEPGSQWSVDFDKDKCRLIRLFGPESDRNIMVLEQYFPGEYFGLVLAGQAFSEIKWSSKGSSVRFLADRQPTMQEPLVGPLDGYGRSLFFTTVSLKGPDPEAARRERNAPPKPPQSLDPALGAEVKFVEVADANNQVRLMTGSLERPIKVMNECLIDLIGSWGLDADQHRTMTRAAGPANESRALNKIFSKVPWERLNKSGGMDAVRIRTIIGADGKIESCTLVENTDPKLEAEICKDMAWPQIEPALDAAGKPMRSYWPVTFYVTIGAPQMIRLPG